MAVMFLDPVMEKIISAGFRYLEDQVGWRTGMKEDLIKLQENLPKIQAIVHFASSQEKTIEEYRALNKWLWQLRDAIDDAGDVVDELEYIELEKQVIKNKEPRKVRSIMKSVIKGVAKIGKRALEFDTTLMRLEEAVQKLDKSTSDVDTFLHLVQHARQELQEQQLDLHRARKTGSLLENDLIGRGKEKELVMEWLRNPSYEPRGTDLYRNISVLSIVGHGGMGKTTLSQHVYEDEVTKEFDLKMWVCVSNNFDVKKVIADMLESLKKERPRFETLGELQGRLKEEVMAKKFLLVLDDIWEEDEKDKNKWEDVLAPLASGGFGSKILVTTRMNSVALMFANVIKNKKNIVKIEGLEEDECLQLLNSHAFAGVENPSDFYDYEKLSVIAGEIVKKLLGSPLAAKVIGGVLKDNLDERHWRTVLESNLLGQNSVDSILRLSYIVLPNHLQNCFAFCCMFPQDHPFDKDDLVRMWIALGFIQPSQEVTMEDIGGRYFDVLVKRAFFDKFFTYYKMHDLLYELAHYFSRQGCLRVEHSTYMETYHMNWHNIETVRHLSVPTINPNILRKIEKFKHLRSLFLFYGDSNQDLYSALIKIFKASTNLRLLYVFAPYLKMIPEEIENLVHLRYLKIDGYNLTMMPRSLSKLYHLHYIIYDTLGFPSQPEVDDFLSSDITNLSKLRYLSIDYGVPMLRELPNLPPSLKCLSIWRCHPELKERYQENGGSDWHKIARISDVFIGP